MNDKTRTPFLRAVPGILDLDGLLSDTASIAALVASADLEAYFATNSGRILLAELRRRSRHRPPRPSAPSLRGTPTAADFGTDHGSFEARLRLGALLAERSATLDSATHWADLPNGAKRIAGRGRGVRGWLSDNPIGINYSTLMRYKRLALLLRELLQLDERIPLEWLLPGTAPVPDLPEALRPRYTAARSRLARLMREHPNVYRLGRHAEEALRIARLPAPRRDSAVPIDETILGNVRREFLAFLRASNLSARQKKIRRAALEWLTSHP